MRPHPRRLDPTSPWWNRVMDAHGRSVAAGRDSYLDPATGYDVLTAAFLLDRGTCCDSGCRHCPFVGGPDLPDG